MASELNFPNNNHLESADALAMANEYFVRTRHFQDEQQLFLLLDP
jgi:hypothetical protein